MCQNMYPLCVSHHPPAMNYPIFNYSGHLLFFYNFKRKITLTSGPVCASPNQWKSSRKGIQISMPFFSSFGAAVLLVGILLIRSYSFAGPTFPLGLPFIWKRIFFSSAALYKQAHYLSEKHIINIWICPSNLSF